MVVSLSDEAIMALLIGGLAGFRSGAGLRENSLHVESENKPPCEDFPRILRGRGTRVNPAGLVVVSPLCNELPTGSRMGTCL